MRASEHISIWAKGDTWWAENEHDEGDIEFTVAYWRGTHAAGEDWTETFTFRAGESKAIGSKVDSSDEIRTRVKRAQFVN